MELLPSRAPLRFRLQLQSYNYVLTCTKKVTKKISLQFELLNTYFLKLACNLSYTPEIIGHGSTSAARFLWHVCYHVCRRGDISLRYTRCIAVARTSTPRQEKRAVRAFLGRYGPRITPRCELPFP